MCTFDQKSQGCLTALVVMRITSRSSVQYVYKEDNMFDENLNRNGDRTPVVPSPVTIGNAGLVILSPFLPRLFHLLHLMESGEFKSTAARIRGQFILQYVLYETNCFSEHELALNKIMTGYRSDQPLPQELELTPEECDAAVLMLQRIIGHWSKFKNYSLSGFRGAFLERNGQLEERPDYLLLTVEQRPYDILLETLPWSYAPISFPWMPKPLQVKWQ